MMFGLLLITLTLNFHTAASRSSNCPNRVWIEQSLEKAHIPGAAIIVVNATHTLYEQAFGYQSLTPKQPINIDKSIFAIASISKTFIGVAVMQLVEGELVDLDTDINIYLSEPQKRIFHPGYSTHSITLRRLLSHTASIAVDREVGYNYFRQGDTAFVESLADVCYKHINPNTSNWLPKPPGTAVLYSNEGSALAALVVERVAKMPYSDYVEANILKPLDIDINKTGFRLTDFSNIEDLVKHYAYAFDTSYLEVWNEKLLPQINITFLQESLPTWLYIPHYGFSIYPTGLLRMSARDLSIYLQAFLNNGSSILHSQSIADMLTPVGGGLIPYYREDLNNGSTEQPLLVEVGLGWYWRSMNNGRRYFGHDGSMPGAVHSMYVKEKNNLGVITLSNGDAFAETDQSLETSATLIDIHESLFQCFDTDSVEPSTLYT